MIKEKKYFLGETTLRCFKNSQKTLTDLIKEQEEWLQSALDEFESVFPLPQLRILPSVTPALKRGKVILSDATNIPSKKRKEESSTEESVPSKSEVPGPSQQREAPFLNLVAATTKRPSPAASSARSARSVKKKISIHSEKCRHSPLNRLRKDKHQPDNATSERTVSPQRSTANRNAQKVVASGNRGSPARSLRLNRENSSRRVYLTPEKKSEPRPTRSKVRDIEKSKETGEGEIEQHEEVQESNEIPQSATKRTESDDIHPAQSDSADEEENKEKAPQTTTAAAASLTTSTARRTRSKAGNTQAARRARAEEIFRREKEEARSKLERVDVRSSTLTSQLILVPEPKETRTQETNEIPQTAERTAELHPPQSTVTVDGSRPFKESNKEKDRRSNRSRSTKSRASVKENLATPSDLTNTKGGEVLDAEEAEPAQNTEVEVEALALTASVEIIEADKAQVKDKAPSTSRPTRSKVGNTQAAESEGKRAEEVVKREEGEARSRIDPVVVSDTAVVKGVRRTRSKALNAQATMRARAEELFRQEEAEARLTLGDSDSPRTSIPQSTILPEEKETRSQITDKLPVKDLQISQESEEQSHTQTTPELRVDDAHTSEDPPQLKRVPNYLRDLEKIRQSDDMRTSDEDIDLDALPLPTKHTRNAPSEAKQPPLQSSVPVEPPKRRTRSKVATKQADLRAKAQMALAAGEDILTSDEESPKKDPRRSTKEEPPKRKTRSKVTHNQALVQLKVQETLKNASLLTSDDDTTADVSSVPEESKRRTRSPSMKAVESNDHSLHESDVEIIEDSFTSPEKKSAKKSKMSSPIRKSERRSSKRHGEDGPSSVPPKRSRQKEATDTEVDDIAPLPNIPKTNKGHKIDIVTEESDLEESNADESRNSKWSSYLDESGAASVCSTPDAGHVGSSVSRLFGSSTGGRAGVPRNRCYSSSEKMRYQSRLGQFKGLQQQTSDKEKDRSLGSTSAFKPRLGGSSTGGYNRMRGGLSAERQGFLSRLGTLNTSITTPEQAAKRRKLLEEGKTQGIEENIRKKEERVRLHQEAIDKERQERAKQQEEKRLKVKANKETKEAEMNRRAEEMRKQLEDMKKNRVTQKNTTEKDNNEDKHKKKEADEVARKQKQMEEAKKRVEIAKKAQEDKEKLRKKEAEESARKQKEMEEARKRLEQVRKQQEEKERQDRQAEQLRLQKLQQAQALKKQQEAGASHAQATSSAYADRVVPPSQVLGGAPLNKSESKGQSEHYDISDLNSDDETDDEGSPKKKVPHWARKGSQQLTAWYLAQYTGASKPWWCTFKPAETVELSLPKIFSGYKCLDRPRTSSAVWNTPPRMRSQFTSVKKKPTNERREIAL